MVWLLVAILFSKGASDPQGMTKLFPTEETCKAAAAEITPQIVAMNPQAVVIKCVGLPVGQPS